MHKCFDKLGHLSLQINRKEQVITTKVSDPYMMSIVGSTGRTKQCTVLILTTNQIKRDNSIEPIKMILDVITARSENRLDDGLQIKVSEPTTVKL